MTSNADPSKILLCANLLGSYYFMKTVMFLISVLIPSLCYSELEKSPTQLYKMNKLITTNSKVTLVVVDDVKKGCNAESNKRGLGGFKIELDACSFFNKTECTIVIGKNTNNDILGHEIRHCFQGEFH